MASRATRRASAADSSAKQELYNNYRDIIKASQKVQIVEAGLIELQKMLDISKSDYRTLQERKIEIFVNEDGPTSGGYDSDAEVDMASHSDLATSWLSEVADDIDTFIHSRNYDAAVRLIEKARRKLGLVLPVSSAPEVFDEDDEGDVPLKETSSPDEAMWRERIARDVQQRCEILAEDLYNRLSEANSSASERRAFTGYLIRLGLNEAAANIYLDSCTNEIRRSVRTVELGGDAALHVRAMSRTVFGGIIHAATEFRELFAIRDKTMLSTFVCWAQEETVAFATILKQQVFDQHGSSSVLLEAEDLLLFTRCLVTAVESAGEVCVVGFGLVQTLCHQLGPTLRLTITRYVKQIVSTLSDALAADEWTAVEVRVSSKHGKRRATVTVTTMPGADLLEAAASPKAAEPASASAASSAPAGTSSAASAASTVDASKKSRRGVAGGGARVPSIDRAPTSPSVAAGVGSLAAPASSEDAPVFLTRSGQMLYDLTVALANDGRKLLLPEMTDELGGAVVDGIETVINSYLTILTDIRSKSKSPLSDHQGIAIIANILYTAHDLLPRVMTLLSHKCATYMSKLEALAFQVDATFKQYLVASTGQRGIAIVQTLRWSKADYSDVKPIDLDDLTPTPNVRGVLGYLLEMHQNAASVLGAVSANEMVSGTVAKALSLMEDERGWKRFMPGTAASPSVAVASIGAGGLQKLTLDVRLLAAAASAIGVPNAEIDAELKTLSTSIETRAIAIFQKAGGSMKGIALEEKAVQRLVQSNLASIIKR